MKIQVAILAVLASAASAFVTNSVPFIKTLSKRSNSADLDQPIIQSMYSRCELAPNAKRPRLATVQKIAGPAWGCYQMNGKNSTFCTVKEDVTDMTTTQYALVTTKLCIHYQGFLQMMIQSPDPLDSIA
ncbi:hypothetical protein BGZ65_008788 [Modicella reniformis]|uniref:Uncharacterized protein n=1 Tax=Modicella reniformis TaxID=1440133 RepID=A0A9P6ILV5_9FUNG|nr:hypothetical protein BGZ65_008788 [Modicella reniformis]